MIKRCVVQVAAINYSLLLERSLDWPTYRTTLIGAYDDPLVVALMVNLMQQEWDRTEPDRRRRHDHDDRLPRARRPKQVLMQIGDRRRRGAERRQRVPGAHDGHPGRSRRRRTCRTASSRRPVPRQSGMVIYDFGLGATIPMANEPPPDNDVHRSIRNKKATTDMMKHFYETGEIIESCTAPKGCDCTVAGALRRRYLARFSAEQSGGPPHVGATYDGTAT